MKDREPGEEPDAGQPSGGPASQPQPPAQQPSEDLPPGDLPPGERPLAPPRDVPPVSAEELVDGGLAGEDEERRYPSTIGGAFYLLVLAVVATGLGLVAFGDWRLGIRVMGGALLFAAAMRVVLPARDAGMLAVRHKVLDAAVLAVLGSALVFLAGSIPDQPGF